MTASLSVYAALTLAPIEVQALLKTIESIPGTKVLTLAPREGTDAPLVFTVSAQNLLEDGDLDAMLGSLTTVMQTAGALLIRQQMAVVGPLPFHTPTSWAVLYGARLAKGTWTPVSADALLSSRGLEAEFSEGEALPVLCHDLVVFCNPPRAVEAEARRKPRAPRNAKG